MSFSTATLEATEQGDVCEVVIRAARITVAMVADLEALATWLDDACTCSVVVFRGHGGRFTQGIDLSDFSLRQTPDIHGFNKWERALAALERLKKITIAAIEGPCRGGGVQLALACDHRIATPTAIFALDEVKNGFLPGLAVYRLAKHVGMGVARYMVLSGQPVDAAEAARTGLIHTVAADLDAEIARAATAFLPVDGVAVSLARRLLNDCWNKPYEDFLGDFLAAQHRAVSGETFQRRLRDEALRPPAP